MAFRHLPLYLNLRLVLGASLIVLQALSPASSQTGNQSDATNPGLSNFSTVLPTQQTELGFRGENVQPAVNQAAASLIGLLSGDALTTSSGETISPLAQQAVLSVLTGDEQSTSNLNSVTSALSAAAGSPPLSTIQNLLSSLKELVDCKQSSQTACAKATVTPAKLLGAIRAYNAMILASNTEFLGKPPAELLAIQASLAKLIAATTT